MEALNLLSTSLLNSARLRSTRLARPAAWCDSVSSSTALPSGAAAQYYPVMHFVDKNQTGMPSTCGGDVAASPMLATIDECAASCDATPGSCVGFSYFPHADGDLCFLFSRLTSAT
jgi:hypothetical protein